MRYLLLLCFSIACAAVGVDAAAQDNTNGKWVLHNAGPHAAKADHCAFEFPYGNCYYVQTYGGNAADSTYVYILATDVTAIGGVKYGLRCEGPFFFYSWTKCSDLELPTPGWPGCGESNAQTWSVEQPGVHVMLGVLHIYVYSASVRLWADIDSRSGYAEFCDGTEPVRECFRYYGTPPGRFGCIGFNGNWGYNPCYSVPTDQTTWGTVKALYR